MPAAGRLPGRGGRAGLPGAARSCDELRGLSVYFPAMSDPRDEDLPGDVVNVIEDAVVADPEPPALLVAGQLDRAGRTRVVFQSEDCAVDVRTEIWREITALALSRRPKQDGIGHQAGRS